MSSWTHAAVIGLPPGHERAAAQVGVVMDIAPRGDLTFAGTPNATAPDYIEETWVHVPLLDNGYQTMQAVATGLTPEALVYAVQAAGERFEALGLGEPVTRKTLESLTAALMIEFDTTMAAAMHKWGRESIQPGLLA